MVCVNNTTQKVYIYRYFFENMSFFTSSWWWKCWWWERTETEIEFVGNFSLLFPRVHCFPCYSIEIEFVRNISRSSVPLPIIQRILNKCKNWNRWNTLLEMNFTPRRQQKSDFWSQLSNYFVWLLMVLKTLMFILLICHQVQWFWDFF